MTVANFVYKKINYNIMLSDNDVFTALFLALVTGALAMRLAIALYV